MENRITPKDIFVCLDEHHQGKLNPYRDELQKNFFGFVATSLEQFNAIPHDPSRKIYLSGFVTQLFALDSIKRYSNFAIISDFILFEDDDVNLSIVQIDGKEHITFNVMKISVENPTSNIECVRYGRVPINVAGIGIYVRECYDDTVDWFGHISMDHQFQNLTEGNKDGVAYRTGIYITPVKQVHSGLEFCLLRCSSNFTGGTDNFSGFDRRIVDIAQTIGDHSFEQKVELNHILAQIYWNKTTVDNSSDDAEVNNCFKNQINDKKAVIKAHSDKTKDMPRNALMAFASFYKDYNNRRFERLEQFGVRRGKEDPFDFVYHNASVLTVLRFVLKNDARINSQYDSLPRKFDLVLYPNSLFMMSLVGNRLYTHEIVPSGLPVSLLPTRMGYVIRCSKTKAFYVNGKTHMIVDGNLVEMVEMTQEQRQNMKKLYSEENGTINIVEYPLVISSMNRGDYMQPTFDPLKKKVIDLSES